MAAFLIVGNINVETNVNVGEFPIQYEPAQFVFDGIQTNVSGVGYNLTKSLVCLGNEVKFAGVTGQDLHAQVVRNELAHLGIDDQFLLPLSSGTSQSVILYDKEGKRHIYSDLKNIQQLLYPPDRVREALQSCELCVLTNINFARHLIPYVKEAGIRLACDVQAITSLDDEYNQDFMANADILFFSNDRIGERAITMVHAAAQRYKAQVIVAGMGAAGTYMYVRDEDWYGAIPSYEPPRPIQNTVGAGDALYSSFLHFYLKTNDAQYAIRRAMLYAAWKIGESGGAQGFIDESGLEMLFKKMAP